MARKVKKRKKILVLLLDDLPNLGQRGEVVEVRPGYFRYLSSLGKVALATKEELEGRLKPLLLSAKLQSREEEAKRQKEMIESFEFEYTLKEGKQNQIFNPLTKEKLVKFLKEKGLNISKSQIILPNKITTPGEHLIPIHLGYGIEAKLKVTVKKGS